jgi:hypothetical protein
MQLVGNDQPYRTAVQWVLLILILVLVVGLSYTTVEGLCGTERWAVKTGSDVDAPYIDQTYANYTSVGEMGSWTRPAHVPTYNRVDPVETNLWYVEATLVQFRRDTDRDYHLVLQDAYGNTMIAEIPDPACVDGSSVFSDGIANARAEMDAVFNVTTAWRTVNVPVQIIGVGFFDFNHGQTGHAPNYVELHPVLDIQFP